MPSTSTRTRSPSCNGHRSTAVPGKTPSAVVPERRPGSSITWSTTPSPSLWTAVPRRAGALRPGGTAGRRRHAPSTLCARPSCRCLAGAAPLPCLALNIDEFSRSWHRCYPPPCCSLQSITLCTHTTCSTVCTHQAAVHRALDVFVEMVGQRQQALRISRR